MERQERKGEAVKLLRVSSNKTEKKGEKFFLVDDPLSNEKRVQNRGIWGGGGVPYDLEWHCSLERSLISKRGGTEKKIFRERIHVTRALV